MCGQTRDDSSHFFKCRNGIEERAFKKMLERILKALTKVGPAPIVRNIVMLNLKAWREGKPPGREICEVQRILELGEVLARMSVARIVKKSGAK